MQILLLLLYYYIESGKFQLFPAYYNSLLAREYKPLRGDKEYVDLKQQSKLPVDFLLVYNKGELSKTSGRFSSGI